MPSLILVLAVMMGIHAKASGSEGQPTYKISGFAPAAFTEANPLEESLSTVALSKRRAASNSFRYIRAVQLGNTTVDGTYGVATLTPADFTQEYLTAIQFGEQWFEAIVDTGSSDTWAVETGFECVDVNLTAQPESACMFGPTYGISSTFSQIADENFNITYGDGEFLTGIVGYEKVTLANITVSRQEVAIVDRAYWNGDNISSGSIGLAYPSLTSAYPGTDPTTDNYTINVEYSPIFTTMYTSGQVRPLFSLVLERGSGLSQLGLGGVPPGYSYLRETDIASAPIQIIGLGPLLPAETAYQYSFYTIYPDGFTYRNASETTWENGNWPDPLKGPSSSWTPLNSSQDTIATDFPMIVDSGTTLLYLPTGLANAILSLYEPPGYFSEEYDADIVLCNATAPIFGVSIGGETFNIDSADLISDEGLPNGICLSGIQDGADGPYILGDVFLLNVIAI